MPSPPPLPLSGQDVHVANVPASSWRVQSGLASTGYAGFSAAPDSSHLIDVMGVSSKALPEYDEPLALTPPQVPVVSRYGSRVSSDDGQEVLGRNSSVLQSWPSVSMVAQRSSASFLRSVNKFLSIRKPDRISSSRSAGVEVLHFVSFGERQSLLRASPLSTILAGGARILSSNGGDAGTYALSMPVKQIDVFISHNWVTSRLDKFLSLSLYYNFWRAVCFSLTVQVLAMCLAMADLFPVTYVYWSIYPRGVCCRLLGIPAFLLGLALGGDMWRWLGWKGPSAFLDKTCIHQSDKTVQKMGISKLGAFLCNSKKMLVVYTDVYLTKLWTVYEFACFCSLHPVSDIQLLPVFLTRTMYLGLTGVYLCNSVAVAMEYWGWFYNILEVALFLATPLLTHAFRVEAKARLAMKRRFQDFTVDSCTCSCEEDRPLVYGNIADLMRAAEVVQWSTSQKVALAQFNTLVRKKLPRLVDTAMGNHAQRYCEAALIAIPATGPALLDSVVGIAKDMRWSEAVSDVMTRCTVMLLVIPLAVIWVHNLMDYWMNLRPCLEVLYVLGVAWSVGALYCSVCNTAMTILWTNSSFPDHGTLDLPFWLNICIMVFNVCALLWTLGIKPGSLLKCVRLARRAEEWLVERHLSDEDRGQMERRLSELSDEADKRRGSADLSTQTDCSELEVDDPTLLEQMLPERPCEHPALMDGAQRLAVGRPMAPIVKGSVNHLTGCLEQEISSCAARSATCCSLQQCRNR